MNAVARDWRASNVSERFTLADLPQLIVTAPSDAFCVIVHRQLVVNNNTEVASCLRRCYLLASNSEWLGVQFGQLLACSQPHKLCFIWVHF